MSSINKSLPSPQSLIAEVASPNSPTDVTQSKSNSNTILNANSNNGARNITNMGIVYPNKATDDGKNTNKTDKTSLPESHILIKNVSSLNTAMPSPQSSIAEVASPKSPTEDIQSKLNANANSNIAARNIINMGIVYPDKATDDGKNSSASSLTQTNMGIVYPPTRKDALSSANRTALKVVPNSNLLKTAQTQLQSLNNNKNNVAASGAATNVSAASTAQVNKSKLVLPYFI